ncbi:receptor-like serine/threonine-protein kinase sd1-7 [Phtheirospermum japonicum]|uniref:Receptor-like serine/threonine-protein kinase sd1-7 n=1 Tax=Phtheirospermum japonicum TaxID=374723 RepID=A0A830BVB3_9LAMI|nr:receptor-like serine/threonine-protein kinase sd1-7 [Phtheirospermum japonicum]
MILHPETMFSGLKIRGLPETVAYKGTMKRYRSGKWNGLYFSGTPRFPNPIFKPELDFENDSGYMAPEYAIDGNFSVKSDIFSLGVIFEKLWQWWQAWLLWKEKRILELMDESLNDTFVESEVKRCIQVGLLCVQKFVEDRPVMSSVIFMLGNDGAILPEPNEPGFFVERSCSPDCTLQSKMSYKATISITDLEAR